MAGHGSKDLFSYVSPPKEPQVYAHVALRAALHAFNEGRVGGSRIGCRITPQQHAQVRDRSGARDKCDPSEGAYAREGLPTLWRANLQTLRLAGLDQGATFFFFFFFWKVVICYRCRSVSHSQAGSWSTVYGVGMYAVRCYTRLPAFLSQGSAEHGCCRHVCVQRRAGGRAWNGTNRGSLGVVGTRIPRRTYAPP